MKGDRRCDLSVETAGLNSGSAVRLTSLTWRGWLPNHREVAYDVTGRAVSTAWMHGT